MKRGEATFVVGIGNDIVEIARIAAACEAHGERFLRRIFTEKEREYCFSHTIPFPHLAARFCAKEAVAKALGTGMRRLSWREIEITRTRLGAPQVLLSPSAQERFGDPLLLVSMSHCREYAVATALHYAHAIQT